MRESKVLKEELSEIKNWRHISMPSSVIATLSALCEEHETILEIAEGFSLNGTLATLGSGEPSVIALTESRMLFLYSYNSAHKTAAILYQDIKDITMRDGKSVLRCQVRSHDRSIVFTVTKQNFDRRAYVTVLKKMIRADRINNELFNQRLESKVSDLSKITDATKHARVIISALNSYKNFDNNPLFLNSLIDDVLAVFKILLRKIATPSEELKLFLAIIILNLRQNIIKERERVISALQFETMPLPYRRHILSYWNAVHNEIYRRHKSPREQLASIKRIAEYDTRHKSNERAKISTLFNTIVGYFFDISNADDGWRAELIKELEPSILSHEELREKQLKLRREEQRAREAPQEKRAQRENEIDTNESVDDILAEIDTLIGMESVKKQIRTFINFIKVQNMRRERGLPTTHITTHAVFNGPPGTGKTTIARYLGRMYRALKLLKKGHMIETDRAGLVAGYVGQTAIQVNEIVEDALDGVLFIDEAYSLSPENAQNDFGQEAIDALLKRMEDYRERIAVIVAGYPKEMKRFIESNPGLQSRFNRYFYFEHYEPDDLIRIFDTFIQEVTIELTGQARSALRALFKRLYSERTRQFGNGRLVRNIFEKVVEKQANRIARLDVVSDEELCSITKRDIPLIDELHSMI